MVPLGWYPQSTHLISRGYLLIFIGYIPLKTDPMIILVLVIGARDYIIPWNTIYTGQRCILPIGRLYATDHLLQEPDKSVDGVAPLIEINLRNIDENRIYLNDFRDVPYFFYPRSFLRWIL